MRNKHRLNVAFEFQNACRRISHVFIVQISQSNSDLAESVRMPGVCFDYLLAQRTLHPCWQFSTSTSAFTSSTFQWGPSVKAWAMTPQRSWRMNIIYLQCQTMRMKRMAVAKQVENVSSHLHNTAASISIHTYFSKPHTQRTHHPRWHKDFAWARRPTQCWARRPTNSRCAARTLTTYYNIFSMIFALL